MSSSSSVKLVGVTASDIPDVWGSVIPLLGPAIERSGGRLSKATVLEALLQRDMQLWLAVDRRVLAAMTTEILIHPTGMRTMSIVLVGGAEMDRWEHLWPDLEDWARQKGCAKSEIPRGRKGWLRRLKGWNEMTFMEKDL